MQTNAVIDQATLEALRLSMRDNSANRIYYRAALEGARTTVDFDDLAEILRSTPAPATCQVDSRNAITNLINKGGLVQSIFVDDAPYEGTYADLMEDETIPEDALVSYYVDITPEGEALLEETSPASSIASLLASKPDRAASLIAVLDLCAATDEGARKSLIEAYFKDHPEQLATAKPAVRLSPSYFTCALEDAGALVWNDGAWVATQEGKAALAVHCAL